MQLQFARRVIQFWSPNVPLILPGYFVSLSMRNILVQQPQFRFQNIFVYVHFTICSIPSPATAIRVSNLNSLLLQCLVHIFKFPNRGSCRGGRNAHHHFYNVCTVIGVPILAFSRCHSFSCLGMFSFASEQIHTCGLHYELSSCVSCFIPSQ